MTVFTCTEHDWRPLPAWSGRYMCARRWCGAIGYRGIVTADLRDADALCKPENCHSAMDQVAWQAKPKNIARIIPYACTYNCLMEGEPGKYTTCGYPVVQFKSEVDARRTRKPRCMEHKR